MEGLKVSSILLPDSNWRKIQGLQVCGACEPGRIGLWGKAFSGRMAKLSKHAHKKTGRGIVAATNTQIPVEQLRAQLEALQREAEEARGKANSARARFMRLTDTVDKLRLQAAASVKAGKDVAAREMLLQKKKVMQALEKSKCRVELFDKLSSKLGEAISIKETQLIKTLASARLETDIGEDIEGPIRIVSPNEEASILAPGQLEDQLNLVSSNMTDVVAEEILQPVVNNDVGNYDLSHLNSNQRAHMQELLNGGSRDSDDDSVVILKGIDSYQSFLDELNKQVTEMESKMHTLLKFSTLILEDEAERLRNQKVKTTMEILEALQEVKASCNGNWKDASLNVLGILPPTSL